MSSIRGVSREPDNRRGFINKWGSLLHGANRKELMNSKGADRTQMAKRLRKPDIAVKRGIFETKPSSLRKSSLSRLSWRRSGKPSIMQSISSHLRFFRLGTE